MISRECHKITRRIDKLMAEATANYDKWSRERREEYLDTLASLEEEWRTFPLEERIEASHFYSEGPERIDPKAQVLHLAF